MDVIWGLFGFGTVLDGTRCTRCFCCKPYQVHVPEPRRIWNGQYVDGPVADGCCAGSVVAILPAQQHEAPIGSNAAIYRRRRLSALCDRQWRARSLWTIRLKRCGGKRRAQSAKRVRVNEVGASQSQRGRPKEPLRVDERKAAKRRLESDFVSR